MLAYRSNPKTDRHPMHAADTADNAEIAQATQFTTSLFLGRGQWDKIATRSLVDARLAKLALTAAHPECTRVPLVYATGRGGQQLVVPEGYEAEDGGFTTAKAREFRETPAQLKQITAAKTYSKKSNAQRAARKALGQTMQDGLGFVTTQNQDATWSWHIPSTAELGLRGPVVKHSVQINKSVNAITPAPDAGKPALDGPDLDIPAFVKLTPEQRTAARARDAAKPAPVAVAPSAPSIAPPAAAGPVAPPAAKTAPAAKSGGGRGRYDWASAEEAARQGIMPAPYDTSARTWAGNTYRGRMDRIVAMALAGNVAGLEAEAIPDYDSGFKIMLRWRALAVLALRAKKA